MARRCGVVGKGVLTGNNVSHAHNKTRRRFLPNMQKVSFMSDILDRCIQLRMSTQGIRTVEKCGGLDKFLLNASASKLSGKVLELKRIIERRNEAKKA